MTNGKESFRISRKLICLISFGILALKIACSINGSDIFSAVKNNSEYAMIFRPRMFLAVNTFPPEIDNRMKIGSISKTSIE